MSIDELNSEEKDKNFPIRLLTVIFSARISIDVHLTRETFGREKRPSAVKFTLLCILPCLVYFSLPELHGQSK